MAEGLAAWLESAGLSFTVTAQAILDTTGAESLDDLVEFVEAQADLADLLKDDVGMPVIHVKKLLKAILQEIDATLHTHTHS